MVDTSPFGNITFWLDRAIHTYGFGNQRDALIETWDALCLTDAMTSFPLLSLSKTFRRQWHSLYKALERGVIKEE